MKSLLIILTFGFSFTAIASDKSICLSPYKTICSERDKSKSLMVESEINKIKSKIRWSALKPLGIRNWSDYYHYLFKKIGIEPVSYNLGHLKAIREIYSSHHYNDFNDDVLIPNYPTCQEKIHQLMAKKVQITHKDQANEETYKKDLKNILAEAIAQIEDIRRQHIDFQLQYKDQMSYVYNHLKQSNCSKPQNCNKLNKMKEDFLNISLNKKVKNFKQNYLMLINEIDTWEPKNSLSYGKKLLDNKNVNSTELNEFLSNYKLEALCQTPGTAALIKNKLKTESKKILSKVYTSKQAIELITREIYNNDNYNNLYYEFEEIKNDIIKLIESWGVSDKTLADIAYNFSQIKLAWLKMPADEAFIYDSETQLKVLDLDKVETSIINLQFLLEDPEALFLSTINAFYMPHSKYGKSETASMVNMFPYFIKLFKHNKLSVISVLAHELAHSIDYNLAKMNGFSELQDVYKNIIECYSNKKSFMMQRSEYGETLSDYISSEVMTKYLNPNDHTKNKLVVQNSMDIFCEFTDASEDIYTGVSHPFPIFRINAIFMANPTVRNYLGCKAPQEHFQNCSISKYTESFD